MTSDPTGHVRVESRSPAALAAALLLAMTVSTVMGPSIGALAPLLRDDLRITAAQLGILVAAYQGAGGLLSPVLGRFIHGLGGRRALMLHFGYCVLAILGVAAAGSFELLLVALFVAGIPGATSNPLTNYVISAHAPVRQKGTVLGIKQSGVQAGFFVAGATLPAVGVAYGWQRAMLVLVALPVLGGWLTAVSVPKLGENLVSSRVKSSTRALVSHHRFLIWIALYATLMGAGASAVNVYLPLFAFDVLGYSVQISGLIGAVIGVFGIVARLIWARLAERRVEALRRDLAVIAAGSLATTMLVLIAPLGFPIAIFLAAVGYGGITSAWNVLVNMAVINRIRLDQAAAATGFVQVGFYAGLMLGPVSFGLLLDVAGYRTAFIAAAASFAGAVFLMALWGRRHPVGQEVESPTRSGLAGPGVAKARDQ